MRMYATRRVTTTALWLGVVVFGAAAPVAVAQTVSVLLDRPARLDVRDVSLAKALQQLADRSRVALVYSPSLLPANRRVTCSCLSATTRQALDTLLTTTGFTFRESDGLVILVLLPPEPPRVAASDAAAPTVQPLPMPELSGGVVVTATIAGRV